ncbi:hypothetical protein BV898_11263 [Hypsibius exemplaris]|uniref:Uncharacterized protein n=1 Tax=Hypsibius exemplaris TaxID=2072580 RepID=A0A1W0WH87_HYPEX|nr:hypothetical protein BV898_11263 [Hypsibius exemplaris]
MADQIAFLAATLPADLQGRPEKVSTVSQTPTKEPGSDRVRHLIAAVQCAIAICAIIYAIAYRFVVRFVDYVHNVSDLAFAALLIAMLATLTAGVLSILIMAYQMPQYSHPSSQRTLQLVLVCIAAFLSVTAFVNQAVAVWFSGLLVPHFPIQGVELPHHAFLLVLTILCGFVNWVAVHRYASDVLHAFTLEEKLKSLSVVT